MSRPDFIPVQLVGTPAFKPFQLATLGGFQYQANLIPDKNFVLLSYAAVLKTA